MIKSTAMCDNCGKHYHTHRQMYHLFVCPTAIFKLAPWCPKCKSSSERKMVETDYEVWELCDHVWHTEVEE